MISLFILLPLYCLGIQHERGGWWRLFLIVAVPAFILDVLLNYLTWPLLWGWPSEGQYTITKRLSYAKQLNDWRGPVAQYLCRVLNAIAPSGVHCK